MNKHLGHLIKNRDGVQLVDSNQGRNGPFMNNKDTVNLPGSGLDDFEHTQQVVSKDGRYILPDRGIRGDYAETMSPMRIDEKTGMISGGELEIHEETHVRNWPGSLGEFDDKANYLHEKLSPNMTPPPPGDRSIIVPQGGSSGSNPQERSALGR